VNHQVAILFNSFLDSGIRESAIVGSVKVRLCFLNDRFTHEGAEGGKPEVIEERADDGSQAKLQDQRVDEDDWILGLVDRIENSI